MATTGSFVDVRFALSDDAALAARAPREWREKAAAKRFECDARLELVAGGLLVEMLASRGVFGPSFAVGPFGKPELVGVTGVHFNLSHARGLVLCVVADRPVGCDVERIVLAPGRDRDFYADWTRREAGLKMLGCGFATGTPFDAPPHPAARNISAPVGYAAAIARLQTQDNPPIF